MINILVDADGCPVVDSTIQIAKNYEMPVTLFCDTAHNMQRDGAKTVMVSKGMDAVDFVLVNRVKPGDIVITQDYGLAAMVLAKRGLVMDKMVVSIPMKILINYWIVVILPRKFARQEDE